MITYRRQFELLQRAFLSPADIVEIVPIGINRARKDCRMILEGLKGRELKIYCDRTLIVPTNEVIQFYNLNYEEIKKYACIEN